MLNNLFIWKYIWNCCDGWLAHPLCWPREACSSPSRLNPVIWSGLERRSTFLQRCIKMQKGWKEESQSKKSGVRGGLWIFQVISHLEFLTRLLYLASVRTDLGHWEWQMWCHYWWLNKVWNHIKLAAHMHINLTSNALERILVFDDDGRQLVVPKPSRIAPVFVWNHFPPQHFQSFGWETL